MGDDIDATTAGQRRLAFIAEWYQEKASVVKRYVLSFFLMDNAIEIYDQQAKKMFLRRTTLPTLSQRDLYVGSKINIFGRQFDIVDYGDQITRNLLDKYRKKTFMLVKNFIFHHLGFVLCTLIDCGFSVNNGLMAQFTAEQVRQFLGDQAKGDVSTSSMYSQLLAGPAIGFELIADNAIDKLKNCQAQNEECFKEHSGIPPALVSLFKNEEIRHGIYCAQNEEDVRRNVEFFFNPRTGPTATCVLKNSTLALIKPHCIKEGNLGKVIREITSNGYKITGLRMHLLENANCAEFHEIYRGVLSDYIGMVAQLCSGVSMALEVVCTDDSLDTHAEFRKFCGPSDPEIAQQLRPESLHALFGVSKVNNGVHCTDLPEDCLLELQYMFLIMGNN